MPAFDLRGRPTYTTEDGYINTAFRICGKKTYANDENPYIKKPVAINKKPVAIYQHGLLDCCASIVNNEEKSLGLKLVEKGYDLWINNSRGNRYSRDHKLFDVDNNTERFFDFSFQEMAQFDQPALWDYVLKTTG